MTSTGACPQCGTLLDTAVGFCGHCGAQLDPGAPLTTSEQPPAFSAMPTAPPPVAGPPMAPPGAAPPPPPGPPGPPAASPPSKQRNPAMIIGGLVGAVALVGTVFVLTSKDDETTTAPASTTTVVGASTTTTTSAGGSTSSVPAGTLNPSTLGPGEVLLEPVNVPTAEPFTDPVGAPETPPTVALPEVPLPTTTAPMGEGQVALLPVTGNVPGLYGGTRNAAECNQQAMIGFLEANPDKAAAWASVHGIVAADIRSYIEGLTPVVLTRDTRVTNHGFRNGQAFAHPSVLQRGHAVLVDRWGVPRAKCSCGNPLAPPVPMSQPPTYVGDPWPDFDVTVIIVVVAGDPVVEGFVLVDLTTGELIIRTVGATPDTPDLATGDIRVTLRWNDAADLDLAVTDPFGETVSFDNPAVSSGGTLDVDANSGCGSVMAAPAENIIWSGTPPDGTYLVTVDDFDGCGAGDSHAFELTVLVGGVPVQISDAGGGLVGVGTIAGSVSSGAPTAQYSFAMGAGGPPGPGADPGGEYTDPSTASATILDLLLLDCGVQGDFTDGGAVEGGWRWVVSTPDGVASFVVYEPLGEWYVAPEDEVAASIAVSCGFYTP